jgi:hypothetical protein
LEKGVLVIEPRDPHTRATHVGYELVGARMLILPGSGNASSIATSWSAGRGSA